MKFFSFFKFKRNESFGMFQNFNKTIQIKLELFHCLTLYHKYFTPESLSNFYNIICNVLEYEVKLNISDFIPDYW